MERHYKIMRVIFILSLLFGGYSGLPDLLLGDIKLPDLGLNIESDLSQLINSIRFVQCIYTDLPIDENEIEFYLYTKENIHHGYKLKIDDCDNLHDSLFDSSRGTKIFVHGWNASSFGPRPTALRKAYLKSDDVNFISVEWIHYSSKPYPTAVQHARAIGEAIGKFLKYLKEEAHLEYCDLHLIGHSLGAHITGSAGQYLCGESARITGVDPAAPCYEWPIERPSDSRLSCNDAQFVDVIHTAGGLIGFLGSIGHADFFPNGGIPEQPGCPDATLDFCSHNKAFDYMIESIKYPYEFLSRKCGSWIEYEIGECDRNHIAYMGNACDPRTRGNFYLTTNSCPPYGKNH